MKIVAEKAILVVLGLLIASCTASTDRVADVSDCNGFAVGQIYTSRVPTTAVTWGLRTHLVTTFRLASGVDEPVQTRKLEAGTKIKVTRICEKNTMTHGMDQWPEAIVLNGKHSGTVIALGQKGLVDRFASAADGSSGL